MRVGIAPRTRHYYVLRNNFFFKISLLFLGDNVLNYFKVRRRSVTPSLLSPPDVVYHSLPLITEPEFFLGNSQGKRRSFPRTEQFFANAKYRSFELMDMSRTLEI